MKDRFYYYVCAEEDSVGSTDRDALYGDSNTIFASLDEAVRTRDALTESHGGLVYHVCTATDPLTHATYEEISAPEYLSVLAEHGPDRGWCLMDKADRVEFLALCMGSEALKCMSADAVLKLLDQGEL